MKVIVDECLPNRLARALVRHDHEAVLVQKAGYGGLKDKALLSVIQDEFDAFIIIDGNLTHQQNLSQNAVGILVLGALSDIFEDIEPLIPDILRARETLEPGDVAYIS